MAMKKIFSMSLVALVAGCASSPAPEAVKVPEALNPGAGEKLALVVPAKGDQIYECRARKDGPATQAAALEWAFVAPEAELYDGAGKKIGRHYAGPHWEAADGSRLVGAVKQRADAQSAKDIPWLLLGAKSVGKDGAFSRVTSIQRVATVGGVAPTGGCTLVGQQTRVPYTADYYFFTSK
jgi:hypothetical protein